MEADERYVFTLDGQLAAVDDYLEVRPETEGRIRRLVGTGRLRIGPWQILMDEFLASGESILRNLEHGLKRGEELGGAMPVGYLPDMFGHTAQMPQMLRHAGIEHAIVWRGVPAAIDRHAFRWEAPDGSWVRAEYLPDGYGNGAYLLDVPDRLAARVEVLHEGLRPFFGDEPLLAMYGTDHAEPLPELIDVVERVNAAQEGYEIRLGTLSDYLLDAVDGDALPRWRGEMRSGARANLLPGVVSTRIDLKAACARAERLLERYAEPLQALYGEGWPEPLLSLAWSRVIQNSAHDSICGCSVDAVSEQVLVRYAEAEQIGEALTAGALARVADGVPRGALAVLNPSPSTRADLVELEVPIPEPWPEVGLELPDGTRLATQETARADPLLFTADLPAERIPELWRRLHGRELFGRWLNGFSVDEDGGSPRLTLHVDEVADPPFLDVDELKREVELAASAADATWRVRIVARPRRTLLARVTAPPLGWTAVRPADGSAEAEATVGVGADGVLRNGLVEVEVSDDGCFRLAGGGVELSGAGRLVDGGDCGDSYNYGPPAEDQVVDVPDSVAVAPRAQGPLRAEIAVTRTYGWPAALGESQEERAAATVQVPVTTTLELRAGEPFLRVRVSFENPCADHRLRFYVPLAAEAHGSAAEGQFAVVERALEVEGGYGEAALPTFPARGFVDAGGVAVLLPHVLEYEVVDGRELALTILRATGLISRNRHPAREDPAGPEVPIPAAQCRRPWSVAFALYPHAGSWREAGVLEQMEAYQHPFVVAHGTGGDGADREPAGVEVAGENVLLSSLRRRDDWLELRLACQQPEPTVATISGRFREAREADALGRPGDGIGVKSGAISVPLRAWEIKTVQVRS